MIPPEYSVFFATMAAVEATLFGLIFLVISIAPESIIPASAPLDRQIRASSAYSALLNPLIISLFALVPHRPIGPVVVWVSISGLLQSLLAGSILMRRSVQRSTRFRNGLLILAGFLLYGFEAYSGVRIQQSPTDSSSLGALAYLLIVLSIIGVARAWELVGVRQYHVRDLLSSLAATDEQENATHRNAADSVIDSRKEGR